MSESVTNSEYVTNEAWLRQVGRVDAIDEIADQFERREPQAALPKAAAPIAWPRSSRGWNAAERLRRAS